MRLALSSPRTWVVIVLVIMVAGAFMSPVAGGAADQELVPPVVNHVDAAEPSTGGMGDRTGVQETVTYTVRNADGKVIEQGVTGP